MLADDRRSWQLQPDATWARTEALEGREGTIDTFEVLKEDALATRQRRRPRRAGPAPAPARWTRAHEPRPVARPVEVELKYRVVDLAAAERYLVADEIGAFSGTAAARSSQFEDRYVDTADGALARAGFAVRLRQSGRGTIVSVKSLGTHRRRRRLACAARSSKVRPTGPPGRSTGRRPTPARSSSSWPATPRSSSS